MKKPSLKKICLLVLVSGCYFLLIPAYLDAQPEETQLPFQTQLTPEQRAQIPKYVPGEILVNFKEGADPQAVLDEVHVAAKSIARAHSITDAVTRFKKDYKLEKSSDGWYWFLDKEYKEMGDIPDEKLFQEAYQLMSPIEKSLYRTYKITVPKGTIVEHTIDKLESHPDVEFAERNGISIAYYTPADPYYNLQWAHQNTSAEQAWDIVRGNSDIIIAIIDSGVDYNHEDLAANIWRDASGNPGMDFVDFDITPYIPILLPIEGEDYTGIDNDPSDFNGHGTHCAGIADAVADNSRGVVGISHNCRIMPVRAGCAVIYFFFIEIVVFPDDAAINAIRYAADNGADVISMSFGGPGEPSDAERQAIDHAYNKGVTLVAAAGNSGNDEMNYPAAFDNVIAVSATASDDSLASYSNYGSWIDVAAPGGDDENPPMIYSTLPQIPRFSTFDGYGYGAGTSMACPYVAGLAGLILSANPALTNAQVRQVLRSTADDLGSPGFDIFYGYGRVNAYNAVLTQATPCEADIESASIRGGSISIVDIAYKAIGATLSSYILDYSTDDGPGSWTEITSAATAVENGSASFTLPVGSGTATMRLRVTDTFGSTYEDRATVEYSTIKITSPLSQGMITNADFTVTGNAAGADLTSYTLECSSLGVITGPVASQVENAVLGTLDGSLLEENTTYTLTLRITTTAGEKTAQLNFSVVRGMLDGWPVSATYEYGGTLYRPLVTTAPAVADIDDDGYPEVVVAGYLGTNPGDMIGVYRFNGALQTGWPKNIAGALLHRDHVVLGDLNNNDRLEIVAATTAGSGGNDSSVFAWNQNGGILAGWPKTYTGDLKGLTLADLDNDGGLDVVVTTLASGRARIEAWDFSGGDITGWPVSVSLPSASASFLEGAVAGDIIADNFKEIIIALSSEDAGVDSRLAIFDYQGSQILNQSVSGVSKFYLPVLGDVDNDGYLEVIVGGSASDSSPGSIYIFQADGTLAQGWPQEAGTIPKRISLADFESDGNPEIIVGTDFSLAGQENSITVFDYQGNINSGWPVSFEAGNIGMRQDPVVGDIDGDGTLEIMAVQQYLVSGNYELRLYAWDENAASLGGYPKVLSADATFSGNGGSPSIADLSQDMMVDIVVPKGDNGLIYAYSLSATFDEYSLPWPVYRHDAQHTASLPSGAGNHVPFLYYIGNRTVDEGVLHEFEVLAYDYDGDTLTYTVENLPAGATFAGKTFSWTPAYTQSGVYSVIFNASDGEYTASETIVIVVNNVNHSPVLSVIGNKTVDENGLLGFSVSASDINGDSIVYSAATLPSGATFIDQDFSWTPNYEQAGTYLVTFSVSDGELSDVEVVTITVNNVDRPPVLDSIGAKTVEEGSLLSFSISATDPDEDALSYSATGLPTGATLSSGSFSWTPGYEQAGAYLVTLSVSDGELTDSETITITVSNVNRAPVLDPIGNKAVGINGSLSFTISGSDPDGDSVAYSVQGLPAGASFTGQSFGWSPVYEQIGSYSVTFLISDSALTDSETITITVREINYSPVFQSIGEKTVYEDNLLQFTLSASDPDGDYIKYSAESLPSGATFSAATFSWTPTSAQIGSHSAGFSASDGELSHSITVTITVNSSTPASSETDTEDSSYTTDSSDTEDAQEDSSSGGGSYLVPMYGENSGAESKAYSTKAAAEPVAESSEEEQEFQPEIESEYQESSRDRFEEEEAMEEETLIDSEEIAEQIDFMRSAGLKDESAIEMVRDGVVSFDHFIYSTEEGSYYIGDQPFEDYIQIAYGIIKQGKQPDDFYYAHKIIENKISRAYARLTNSDEIYETKAVPRKEVKREEHKVPAIPGISKIAEATGEIPEAAETADTKPGITLENSGEEKAPEYPAFRVWLRGLGDKIRARLSSYFNKE